MEDILSFEDISNYILEILSGQRITNLICVKEPVIFIQPTCTQNLYSKYLEKQKTIQYLNEGYQSEESLESGLEFIDSFFSIEEQEQLEEVQSKIAGFKKILLKKDKKIPSYQEDLKRFNELKSEELNLLARKNSSKYFSAEFKAREDRFFYLFSECVLDLNQKRVFNTLEDLSYGEYSLDSVYQDLNKYLDFYFGLSTSKIRQIARSNHWRTYVIGCNRNIITLFNKVPAELCIDQINLMSWTNYYLNIDEMPIKDRPSEEMLNNDDKLDFYLGEYTRKIRAAAEVSKIINNDKSDHTVITAESPNYIKYHKEDIYSDPELISGRGKEGSTEYAESKEYKKIKAKFNKR